MIIIDIQKGLNHGSSHEILGIGRVFQQRCDGPADVLDGDGCFACGRVLFNCADRPLTDMRRLSREDDDSRIVRFSDRALSINVLEGSGEPVIEAFVTTDAVFAAIVILIGIFRGKFIAF
jgi:hypothetical protein